MSLTLLHIFYQVLLVLSSKDIKQSRKLEIVSLSRGQSSKFFHEQNHFSVVFDSLWPHGLQHARPPCPSPTPRVYSNSCPLSQWCHPTISSSVVTFSSCFQSSPASGSFPMSQFFASGGQSIRTSASASVLPINIQHWFLLVLTWETNEQFEHNNQYDIIVGYWAGLLATLHIWLGVLTLDLLSWHNSWVFVIHLGPSFMSLWNSGERKEINVNVKFILPANPWVIKFLAFDYEYHVFYETLAE